jgi:glycosyltransferase involved in cell wall biosynthesis
MPTKILTFTKYPMYFNLPAPLWASTRRTRFLPLNALYGPLGGVACYFPLFHHDVLHTMNHVPVYGNKPWVVTFESSLPRTLTHGRGWLYRSLRARILRPECLGIIAMSGWARRIFETSNKDWDGLPAALRKLVVLHPTVRVRSDEVRTLGRDEPIRLVFVGNRFAAKGGISLLRLAKLAKAKGLSIEAHIVSTMTYGGGTYADHPSRERYAPDLRLLSLPNVVFHGKLSNEEVLGLMRRCHVTFLATLHETYGFSIIEGFSCATPAMSTTVCAQPEINGTDRGVLLRLATNDLQCWTGMRHWGSSDYWDVVDAAYSNLAEQAFEALVDIRDHPEKIEAMSIGALHSVRSRHDPTTAAAVLEEIYQRR